jgi:hypothetical protein
MSTQSATPTPPATPRRRRVPPLALLTVLALLGGFALFAWMAVQTKAPTYDEPLHALGAWLHLHHRDFRVNPEDPPLWHYWAALANGPGALAVDTNSETYKLLAQDIFYEWKYVVEALYRVPGNDAEMFVTRSRAMMLAVAVLLGLAIAWWGRRLCGTVAMVTATAAFALDPNFLAHGPLVKNDVTLSLTMLLLAAAVWRAGQRLTVWNALAIAMLCGIGLTVKFSALLFGPIVVLMLLIRALMKTPWPAHGRELRTRLQTFGAAAAVCVLCAAVSYLMIWAAYGFRYWPTPQDKLVLNTSGLVDMIRNNEVAISHPGEPPTFEELEAWRPGLFIRSIGFLEHNHLLPQAWLNGLVYTYQSAIARETFLLGQHSMTGWWYYFPVTMAVKSPLSLIGAAVIAIGIFVVVLKRGGRGFLREHGWTIVCLTVPAAIYLWSAMRSNLNLGIRHVLPVYPFIYIGIGLAAQWAWRAKPRMTKIAAGVLATGLAIESWSTFPNYIPFFNIAAGGARGGLRLLGDSNLDWGQDLSLVALWHQENTDTKLYLSYFGVADPTYYGITYTNLPGGYFYGPRPEFPSTPGVIAVSATNLQGVYHADDPFKLELYRRIQRLPLIDVLGETIYLYKYSGESLVE